jgi:hypothetical protein
LRENWHQFKAKAGLEVSSHDISSTISSVRPSDLTAAFKPKLTLTGHCPDRCC